MTPDVEVLARDGHFYKEMDTGETYHRVGGEWLFINLGLSFIKATKSGRVTTDSGGVYDVVFATPFINDQYSIQLTCQDLGSVKPPVAFKTNRSVYGFRITTRDSKKGDLFGGVTVSWLATRDYDP